MKSLLVLRHAKSSWSNPMLTDHERPLNSRGRKNAPQMGKLLKDKNIEPDFILCSSAKRAQQTAAAAAKACGFESSVVANSDLYLAGPAAYLEALRSVPDHVQRLLVVGHNPGLECLVLQLTGEEHELPTASLALIELPLATWREMNDDTRGSLQHLWTPRYLE